MIVFAFPAIIAGTALLELERAFDWPFFIAERGGDPLLWQHLFWFFGHPEVYIIFLPAAGHGVDDGAGDGAHAAGRLRRRSSSALVAVGVISFALWAHHMFTAGLGPLPMALVSAASLAVAIPSGDAGVRVDRDAVAGPRALHTPTLFLLGFLLMFVLGGLTGVMVAVLPFDAQVHDTLLHRRAPALRVDRRHGVPAVRGALPLGAAGQRPSHSASALGALGRSGWCSAASTSPSFRCTSPGCSACRGASTPTHAGLGWDVAGTWCRSLGALMLGGRRRAAASSTCVRTLRQRRKREHGDPWSAADARVAAQPTTTARAAFPQVRLERSAVAAARPRRTRSAGPHWLPGTVTGARETLVTQRDRRAPAPPDRRCPATAGCRCSPPSARPASSCCSRSKLDLPTAFACGVLGIVAIVRLAVADRPQQPALRTAQIGERRAGAGRRARRRVARVVGDGGAARRRCDRVRVDACSRTCTSRCAPTSARPPARRCRRSRDDAGGSGLRRCWPCSAAHRSGRSAGRAGGWRCR